MRALPWWCSSVAAIALAGCTTTKPDPVTEEPIEQTRQVLVQTIPRGCWVERNDEYIGVAPIYVPVRTTSSGRPFTLTIIRVQHSSGAWERKIVTSSDTVPEKMLFDLRGLVPPMLQGPGI